MLVATQRKTPASDFFTPVICRMPMGRSVYLNWTDRERRTSDFLSGGKQVTEQSIQETNKPWVFILPFIWCADGHTIFLPGDVGLRNTVHLALKTCHSSLIHRHGLRMSVKLRKSCMRQTGRWDSLLTMVWLFTFLLVTDGETVSNKVFNFAFVYHIIK